jgi:hypothetical protein
VTEMDLLTRLRAEVPSRVSPEAERRFHAALLSGLDRPARPAPTRRRLPLPRIGLAAGLAAAAVVAILVAVPHSPASRPVTSRPVTGQPAAALPTVQELAFHASSAALAAKPVGPGQWVYRKATITIIKTNGVHGRDTTNENWQTADGLHSAWYYHGQLSVYATPTEGKDISYAELAKLPASPAALAKYIYGREQQILGPEPANLNWQMTFNEITGLFSYFALPPKVAAALLAALPSVPGVRVVKDAGSIAFIRSYGNLGTEKVILSPSTYTVTGVVAGPAGGFGKQGAFSAWIPVSGPGARP